MGMAHLLHVLHGVNESKSWLGAIAGAAAFWYLVLPTRCELRFTLFGQVQDCHSVINLGVQWTAESIIFGLTVAIGIGALLWMRGASIYESLRSAK